MSTTPKDLLLAVCCELQLDERELSGTIWLKSMEEIQEENEEAVPQFIQLIQYIKLKITKSCLIQQEELYQTFYPEHISLLKSQGLSNISSEINQWILEMKHRNGEEIKNLKNSDEQEMSNNQEISKKLDETNSINSVDSNGKMKKWENTAKNLANLKKCLTNLNTNKKLRTKPSTSKTEKFRNSMAKTQLKQIKGLKWKFKKRVSLNLQNSKIVKKIFYYNVKLINLPMTSQNKLINKIINLMTSSKIVKENHINKTRRKLTQIRMNIGKEWSQEKNYATLLNRGAKINENQDTINGKEIEIQVCIENWNIQQLIEIISNMRKNEYGKIRWNLWKRTWNILNYKKNLDQVKKWTEWYEKEKVNREMELEE
jgi:hypothetical protein